MSTFEALVIDLNSKGQAVVRHPEGKVFFCSGAWIGERIKVRIVDEKKDFGMGEVLEVIEASPHRLTPEEIKCSHHGYSSENCGGCPWLSFSFQAQSELKEAKALKLKEKVDHLQNMESEFQYVSSPKEWAYRNRAKLHYDQNKLGFQAFESNKVVDIKNCPVINGVCQSQLSFLRENINTLKYKNYYLDDESSLQDVLQKQSHYFKQGNTQQNELLKTKILEEFEFNHHSDGLELFCGSGNFTKILVKYVAQLNAYESKPEAIKALNQKASSKIKGFALDLYNKQSLKKLTKFNKSAEFLFLDPPRSGYKFLTELALSLPNLNTIFYVSCNPSTLDRDITKLIKETPFQMKKLYSLDFFPQTPHQESFVILKK